MGPILSEIHTLMGNHGHFFQLNTINEEKEPEERRCGLRRIWFLYAQWWTPGVLIGFLLPEHSKEIIFFFYDSWEVWQSSLFYTWIWIFKHSVKRELGETGLCLRSWHTQWVLLPHRLPRRASCLWRSPFQPFLPSGDILPSKRC